MRVWLIGAGRSGSGVLRQLWKNPEIEVIVSDPHANPHAVKEGIINEVSLVDRITPVNINQIAQRIRPDIIMIATGAGSGNIQGSGALMDALNYEIAAASEVPCIIISRSNIT